MTPTEAAALLTMASAFDNRKVDPDAATAWAATLHDVRLEDAREAIQRHFRESNEWLMPKHVTAHVKRIRRDRIDAYGTLPDPPSEIDPDDTAAVIAWHADTVRRIGDGEDVSRAMPGSRSLDMAALRELMPRPARGDDVAGHAGRARAAIRARRTDTAREGATTHDVADQATGTKEQG